MVEKNENVRIWYKEEVGRMTYVLAFFMAFIITIGIIGIFKDIKIKE